MFKNHFYHGLLSGIMAALSAIIYDRIYHFATATDFSMIINPGTMISLSVVICLLFSVLYYFITLIFGYKTGTITVVHILFSILSFAVIIVPISISLPLSVSHPELFPGLAVPMVFFPALAWFTFKPLFEADKR